MGMFETTGTGDAPKARKENTLAKLARMKKALHHEEPDRVPISDFFWGGFTRRWRAELGLPDDASPYYHYDLDWIVTIPNMDPWIRPFEMLKETPEEVVIKTGFGAVMRKLFRLPMPEFIGWEIDTLEKLEAAEFDDPRDRRRWFSAGDNQIAGVGDGFERNSPPWVDTVKSLWPDFPVYGSIIECSECMTRLIGPQNHMLWMAMEPERFAAVLARVGQFYFDCAKAKAELCAEYLDTGKLVFLKGDPQIRRWEDKDGRKHSKFEIILQRIQFLSAKANAPARSPDRGDDFVHESDEDDIPL